MVIKLAGGKTKVVSRPDRTAVTTPQPVELCTRFIKQLDVLVIVRFEMRRFVGVFFVCFFRPGGSSPEW